MELLNSKINKIIFYLKNKFLLDDKLIKFYESLNIKQKANNINEFINYIQNLKID